MYRVEIDGMQVQCDTFEEVKALVGNGVQPAPVTPRRKRRRNGVKRPYRRATVVPKDDNEFTMLTKMRRNGDYLTQKQLHRIGAILGPPAIARKLLEEPLTGAQIAHLLGARSPRSVAALGLHFRRAARALKLLPNEVFEVSKAPNGASVWRAGPQMRQAVHYFDRLSD